MLDTKSKSFAWSFSKLKNFETCPRRYQAIDLEKIVKEKPSEALERGDELHEAMRKRVQGDEPLPPHLIYMERWAEKLTRDLHPYQITQTELKLSIDKEGQPTGYFDRNTWLRVKIDYLRILPSERGDAGHLVDYKTGKMPKFWDGTQLMLNAHTVFASYKNLKTLRVEYLWTEYNDTTHEKYVRGQTDGEMEELMPRVGALEMATLTNDFPPKPCGLCENYCPVASCEHNGKRMGRG